MQLRAIFAMPEKPSAFIGCSTGELECMIPNNALQIIQAPKLLRPDLNR